MTFLRPRQASDGSWSRRSQGAGDHGAGRHGPAPLEAGHARRAGGHEGLAYLEQFIGPKGGLSEAAHSNYSTSIALMAFQEANKDGKYDRTIKAGQDFLKTMQWDEGEGKSRDERLLRRRRLRRQQQPARPLEHRVHDGGPPRHRPARRRPGLEEGAGLRLAVPEPQERVQRPALGRQGQRRRLHLHRRQRRLERGRQDRRRRPPLVRQHDLRRPQEHDLRRPHPDDPRVKAAYDYITKHYTLDENPGLGQRGLYYYYQTFAKALAAARQADVRRRRRARPTTGGPSWSPPWPSGRTPNGSWVNPADRFMEGDPNLVTSYGLLALAYAQPKV